MPEASEAIKWILVLDLAMMSVYVIKLVMTFDKQQKDKQDDK